MGTSKAKDQQLYFIDLFAGCGGASLGFETAGFESLGHVEINQIARKTLELNFGEPVLKSITKANGDVTKVNLKELKTEIFNATGRELDLLVACPPCQGFSTAGRAKINSLRGNDFSFINDPRNSLYKSVIKYISYLRPKAVFFENVPGILNLQGTNVAEDFCVRLQKLGYKVKCTLLNSGMYGVPQSRERVIVIAYRLDLNIEPQFPDYKYNLENVGGAWSQPISKGIRWQSANFFVDKRDISAARKTSKGTSVADAFKDLPEFVGHFKKGYQPKRDLNPATAYKHRSPPNEYCNLMRNWPGFKSETVSEHFCGRNPRDYRIFRKMKHGDLFPEAHAIATKYWKQLKAKNKKSGKANPLKAKVVPPYRLDCFPEKWQKMHPEELSCTLTAHLSKDRYSHIHFDSKQARTLTLREAARLQSFPDGYRFSGNMSDIFQQIGNAVPPLLAMAVAKQMLLSFRTSLKQTTDTKFVKKENEVVAENYL